MDNKLCILCFSDIIEWYVIFGDRIFRHYYGEKVHAKINIACLFYFIYDIYLFVNYSFIKNLFNIIFSLFFQMSQIETILTVFKDRFPHIRKKKAVLALCACGIFFSLGLSLTTNVSKQISVKNLL